MGGTTEALRPTGWRAFSFEEEPMRQESGSQRRSGASVGAQEGLGMFVLRLWMWAVPILMLAAAFLFAAYAAVDERWELLVVMIIMGLMAIGLLVFHWWVLYRFGSRPQ
jgi:hypothetical protein